MQRTINRRNKDFHKEYIVITIIVAAKGEHKLPPINSSAELKEALQKLATIPLNSVEDVTLRYLSHASIAQPLFLAIVLRSTTSLQATVPPSSLPQELSVKVHPFTTTKFPHIRS
ncbi:unnamed protein product [Lactuca saligna]|uniref:Uncharacterized protein n=1 Tax=Lactuca saligna TaxID=75948 RepID=A0AA35YAZ7_LACSI|nr:unnamed protein product [Lactuca saligna]